MPVHTLGKWALNDKGYPRFYSGPHRGRYVHRIVWEVVAQRSLPTGYVVHHQSGKCFCPSNLIAMPACFNVSGAQRDPYTGEFLSHADFQRRYSTVSVYKVQADSEVPF